MFKHSKAEPAPEHDEIGNVTEEVVDLEKQINLEIDIEGIQELMESHNPELTIDELIEMHEQDQDIADKLSI
ncbi:hypothetical protein TNCV_1084481 [Trichonephila clavipes]|nr:hypothetical protein TNCV_1084481 [Trichonephila clavipes]